jgi:hypothetical protein
MRLPVACLATHALAIGTPWPLERLCTWHTLAHHTTPSNEIGDAGMISLSETIGKGSLRQLTTLGLNYNQIGDIGMIAFAEALQPTDNFPMGSMGMLWYQYNHAYKIIRYSKIYSTDSNTQP